MALLVFSVPTRAQDNRDFPSNDEINLVLTQTDRAVQQYKAAIDQEQSHIGSNADEIAAVDRDRQVVKALDVALTALKKNPQGFNGPAGFYVILWLDDADRNALLCASQALSQASLTAVGGNVNAADSLVDFSRTCMDASSLLYTVSENASSLYTRYVENEEKVAQEGLEAAQKCVAILKQHETGPKK